MAEFPGASDNFVDESRVFIRQNSHSAIVLHGTGGSPDQTVAQLGAYFATTPAMTSVHYGIDRAGNMAQYVLEADGAAGNCCVETNHDTYWDQFGGDNLNLHTLSIEHVNDITNSLTLTDAQKQASFKLVAYLSKKYAITPDRIKSHASIAPQSRAHCPGNYPWDELFAYLKGGATMGVPTGWADTGSVLTAPNLHTVRDGFREFVLANTWDPANWPLEEEHAQSPLELSNPGLGNGTQQVFRFSMLGWTSDRGVIEEYVGAELLALRAQPANAKQDAINTLQAVDTIIKGAINKLLTS